MSVIDKDLQAKILNQELDNKRVKQISRKINKDWKRKENRDKKKKEEERNEK